MLLDIATIHDGIAVIKASGAITKTTCLKRFVDRIQALKQQGRSGFLIDLSECRRLNASGIVALSELPAHFPSLDIVFCALPDFVQRKFESFGLDRGLVIFATEDQALRHASLRRHTLSRTKALLLCDAVENPLHRGGAPFLDVLGRTVVERNLDWLARFGLRDVVINASHSLQDIDQLFRLRPRFEQSLFYSQHLARKEARLSDRLIAALDVLSKHQGLHFTFSDHFVLAFGDEFNDVDFPDLILAHKASGADLTYVESKLATRRKIREDLRDYDKSVAKHEGAAKPNILYRNTPDQTCGLFVLSPKAIELYSHSPEHFCRLGATAAIQKAGGIVQCYSSAHQRSNFEDIPNYFDVVTSALSGQLKGLEPVGDSYQNGIWIARSARVSDRVEFQGKCHVGDDVSIASGGELSGSNVLHTGATIAKNCVLENCIVLPGTKVEPGFWGQNLLIHPKGSFDFRYAVQDAISTAIRPDVERAEPLDLVRKSA